MGAVPRVRHRVPQLRLNNVLLILSQRPTASRVAGFCHWQERGRQVRKGERAIKIFGYATKRIEGEDGEEERRPYFPILSVFDATAEWLTGP